MNKRKGIPEQFASNEIVLNFLRQTIKHNMVRKPLIVSHKNGKLDEKILGLSLGIMWKDGEEPGSSRHCRTHEGKTFILLGTREAM